MMFFLHVFRCNRLRCGVKEVALSPVAGALNVRFFLSDYTERKKLSGINSPVLSA